MGTSFLDFEIPDFRDSIIKVIGVGGGGSNATNHMFQMGIHNVDFVVCNTDAQALASSPVPIKVQLGATLTEGRGAGNKPAVGRNAAIESEQAIKDILARNTRMVFITAGMGGGTGTGAAPVIAQIAKSMGILTVGIVTLPFKFEGNARIKQAIAGVEEMERNVDTLLIINNERLKNIYGDLFLGEAFAKADEVLATAAKGIAEIITIPGHVNVDFADVQTVMASSGVALMGSAVAAGESRAIHALKMALNSPLLNNNNIKGAVNILLNVTSGVEEFRVDELGEITDYMQSIVGNEAQIIWGNGTDLSLDDAIRVIVIATGFQKEDIHEAFRESPTISVEHLVMGSGTQTVSPAPGQSLKTEPKALLVLADEEPKPVEETPPVQDIMMVAEPKNDPEIFEFSVMAGAAPRKEEAIPVALTAPKMPAADRTGQLDMFEDIVQPQVPEGKPENTPPKKKSALRRKLDSALGNAYQISMKLFD